MRDRIFLALLLVCGLGIAHAIPAAAHVLITDEHDTIGAVVHVTPDDDPIAGKPAHIFFDLQDASLEKGTYAATLTVRDEATAQAHEVPTEVDGSYVSADYAFAVQGTYNLTLDIRSDDSVKRFVMMQRVSRGTPATQQNIALTRHRWAELLLVVASVGLATGTIVATTRIRRILRQSQ